MMSKKISLLVPMYNEEEALGCFFDAVIPVLEKMPIAWEIICVNDGSTDRTLEQLGGWYEQEPRVKVINLSRNFGKERALTAALDFATGDAVIPMDADLQDPPELIPEMVGHWNQGFDIVNAVRTSRKTDSPAKRVTAHLFYRIINLVSDVE
ncbi:MAG: glycosyltransferase family 2 protein, partial [Sedimenticola sp.]